MSDQNARKSLPPRPSLQHLKYQALDLLKAARSGRPEALSRFSTGNTPEANSDRGTGAPPVRSQPGSMGEAPMPRDVKAHLTLADAQRAVAREYGFPSWSKLKRHVESIVGPPDAGPAMDLAPFIAAVRSGDPAAVRKLLTDRPALRKKIDAPVFEMDAPAIVFARHDRAMVDGMLAVGKLEGVSAAPEGGAAFVAISRLVADGTIKADESVVLFNTGGALKYLDVLS